MDKLLKAKEVAETLQISKAQAYRLMATELPCIRFGANTVRIKYEDLLQYVEGHRSPGNIGIGKIKIDPILNKQILQDLQAHSINYSRAFQREFPDEIDIAVEQKFRLGFISTYMKDALMQRQSRIYPFDGYSFTFDTFIRSIYDGTLADKISRVGKKTLQDLREVFKEEIAELE